MRDVLELGTGTPNAEPRTPNSRTELEHEPRTEHPEG
jgi:hypothetical protein